MKLTKNPGWIGFSSRLALLLVGMIWGSSLVVVKSSTETVPPSLLIALRFTLAFAALSAIFWKKFRLINRDYLKRGAIIGLCLFAAYWIQTLGVTLAMPGKSAFLSSIYCVLVPFVYWCIGGGRPRVKNLIAAFLCTFGIILSSLTSEFSIAAGDLLALLSGLFFAIHIAAVGKLGAGKDPVLITILQFGFCALPAWVIGLLFETRDLYWNPSNLWGILYLGLFCSAAALLLQNLGQKYADPSSASILMSTESIFGVIFSVIFMGESLSMRLIFGFLLIFISVLVSELTLSHKRLKQLS